MRELPPRPHDQGTSAPSDRGRSTIADLPIDELNQPDLMLELSTEKKIGTGSLFLTAIVIAMLLGMVFYAVTRGA